MYCNIIATITLPDTSVRSRNFLFLLWEHFKSLSLSNFGVCSTVLLTVIIMLCLRSPECTHLLTANLCPLLWSLFNWVLWRMDQSSLFNMCTQLLQYHLLRKLFFIHWIFFAFVKNQMLVCTYTSRLCPIGLYFYTSTTLSWLLLFTCLEIR